MTTFTIYACLFIATTAYALLLAWLKHLWEPDLTWLEVIIGVVICLLAPYFDQRHNGPLTSELYEQRVWLCFIVGGFPIVVWRIGASVRARIQLERRISRNHGNTTDRATSVASERREESETGD